jgi:hypothetical protein
MKKTRNFLKKIEKMTENTLFIEGGVLLKKLL